MKLDLYSTMHQCHKPISSALEQHTGRGSTGSEKELRPQKAGDVGSGAGSTIKAV